MIASVLRARSARAFVLSVAMLLLVGVAPAGAVPTLQLYIEGATYSDSTETWVTTSDSFKLWVIGDVGGKGSILGVHLTAAVTTGEIAGSGITLTPTTTSLITDPSTPSAPSSLGTSADGAVPVMSDGKKLPKHGIFGPGTSFLEWAIGDFTLKDSPIGDFEGGFPSSFPTTGEVRVYEVSVTGFASGVHFDAFGGVDGEVHATFAPFSHDAEGGGSNGSGGGGEIPWPSALALVLTGVLGAAVIARRRPRG